MSSRLFTCFHYIHIKKTAPLPGAHVITTIFKFVRDIHITNVLTSRIQTIFELNCHIQRVSKLNLYNITRVLTRKNAPPPGGHVFQPINGMNLLTKFHKDRTINVASIIYSHIRKNAPPLGSHVFQAKVTIFELIQDIIGTNLLSKFHDNRKINVTSRVLTRKMPRPLAAMFFNQPASFF
ncbi:hypothetical protein DPMN_014157 [Dreissena polymorpha]|uniref:Uncharacterized protein n=1 Tax=Dreissena polymorpha TaxID=45954 RepID=A0A9D4S373_DREPO|nr:hypothetical protein DPMN_014157 [Dreissena polymorpha]